MQSHWLSLHSVSVGIKDWQLFKLSRVSPRDMWQGSPGGSCRFATCLLSFHLIVLCSWNVKISESKCDDIRYWNVCVPFLCLCLFPICSTHEPHQAWMWQTGRPVYKEEHNNHHTNIQDSLFSSVLAGVPVFPILQLLISAFVFTKDNHDNTLKWKQTYITV